MTGEVDAKDPILMNLSGLSRKELRYLKKRIEREISIREDRAKKEKALADVTAVANKHGFEIADLGDFAKLGTRKKIDPKYRNPDDHENTWTGRGKMPHWVQNALDSGLLLEDLRIK